MNQQDTKMYKFIHIQVTSCMSMSFHCKTAEAIDYSVEAYCLSPITITWEHFMTYNWWLSGVFQARQACKWPASILLMLDMFTSTYFKINIYFLVWYHPDLSQIVHSWLSSQFHNPLYQGLSALSALTSNPPNLHVLQD